MHPQIQANVTPYQGKPSHSMPANFPAHTAPVVPNLPQHGTSGPGSVSGQNNPNPNPIPGWPNPNPHGHSRSYSAGLGLWLSQVGFEQQALGEKQYSYALNNPARFVDPSGLAPVASLPSLQPWSVYPMCPIPKCFGPDGKPLFTDREICNAYKGMPHPKLEGGAGVLCCDGHMSVCIFGAPTWPEYPGDGVCPDLEACVNAHETKHYGDTPCTKGRVGLYRPDWPVSQNTEHENERECLLRKLQVMCMKRIAVPPQCRSATEAAIELLETFIDEVCNQPAAY